jgi:hypothetical protein
MATGNRLEFQGMCGVSSAWTAGSFRDAGRVTIGAMDDRLFLQCPYCGESVELHIDSGGGPRQSYIEDCPVCCRPWQVDAWLEDENSWHATLRTSDE